MSMQHPNDQPRRVTAFEIYLRTGRRVVRGAIERKFNPWHDPDDGKFTFANQGNYFLGGKASQHAGSRRSQHRTDAFAAETDGARNSGKNDPHDPRNHAIYVVRKGDNLTRIAAMRKGLTVRDLEWLNSLRADQPLRIGQQIRLPHQEFLDAGREARNKFFALDYYMRTHGGRLPPDPANPPSLQSQILDHNWHQEIRASYNYYIDPGSRFRLVFGLVTLAEKPKRSRKSQREVPERGPRDDGGHYIAPRLNGPTDWFNHFAQDLHVNRGKYRVMEDEWYKAVAAEKKVFINVKPVYPGASLRPSHVEVTWYIDGERFFQSFGNEKTDEEDGER
jgi:hypothetical protein